MGFLDRLLGRDEPQNDPRPPQAPAPVGGRSEDEIAVERYRYLLRTAPPETIEQVHTEAFGRLTEDQRALLFRQLSDSASASDRPADDSPESLARSATRTEMQQPGTLDRAFGQRGQGGGPGFGSMVGGSLLGTVAGYVIGSALVSSFLPPVGADLAGADGTGEAGADDAGAGDAGAGDSGADGADASADAGGFDGGGFGDGGFGGDMGGGDLGGGDFGF